MTNDYREIQTNVPETTVLEKLQLVTRHRLPGPGVVSLWSLRFSPSQFSTFYTFSARVWPTSTRSNFQFPRPFTSLSPRKFRLLRYRYRYRFAQFSPYLERSGDKASIDRQSSNARSFRAAPQFSELKNGVGNRRKGIARSKFTARELPSFRKPPGK